MDPIWTQLGQLFDGCAQIFDVEVAVDSGRRAHVAMAQQALNAMRIDAGAEEQCRGRVPQIVETHRARDRLRPQRAATRLRERLAGAVGALDALRAVALLVVGVPLFVSAPAADVFVALDQAGARECMPQDLLRVRLGGALLTVLIRKDERARRVFELVLEDREERRRDRDEVRVAALRCVPLV
ncbi:MAG TPA: hypothetical protein VI356_05685 [Myxococcales bacterium]